MRRYVYSAYPRPYQPAYGLPMCRLPIPFRSAGRRLLPSPLGEHAPCRRSRDCGDSRRAEPPRGYFITLAAATAAASVGGFAFWASQNMRIGQPLWWQVGSLAAALVAGKLTLAATKQQGQMRPQGSLLDSFNAKLDAAALALSHMPESEATAKDETPAPSRIEAERERLTKAGFSEAEISQILIARETGAAQGMGGGHGVLSGVLSNLAAVMTHARNFLPSLAADLARMLSRRVPPLQRMEAAFNLVAKCAVIAVLAYVVASGIRDPESELRQRAKSRTPAKRAEKTRSMDTATWNELLRRLR